MCLKLTSEAEFKSLLDMGQKSTRDSLAEALRHRSLCRGVSLHLSG